MAGRCSAPAPSATPRNRLPSPGEVILCASRRHRGDECLEEVVRHDAPVCIASDHPSLAGHFPGMPLVPGVVLLDRVLEAAESRLGGPLRIAGLAQAKFLSPLRPGERAHCSLEIDLARLRFRVEHGGRLVAQGAFALAAESAE